MFRLLLFSALPSLSVLFGMYWLPGTVVGKILFILTKVVFFGGPLYWFFVHNKRRLAETLVVKDTFKAIALGVACAVSIVGAYLLIGRQLIDVVDLKAGVASLDLTNLGLFVPAALYWCFGNSFLEEFTWRFFIFDRIAEKFSVSTAHVLIAALFTVHHSLAMALYFNLTTNAICSIGIFGASIVWSMIRKHYNNLWPCYISHVLADMAIFGTAAYLIF